MSATPNASSFHYSPRRPHHQRLPGHRSISDPCPFAAPCAAPSLFLGVDAGHRAWSRQLDRIWHPVPSLWAWYGHRQPLDWLVMRLGLPTPPPSMCGNVPDSTSRAARKSFGHDKCTNILAAAPDLRIFPGRRVKVPRRTPLATDKLTIFGPLAGQSGLIGPCLRFGAHRMGSMAWCPLLLAPAIVPQAYGGQDRCLSDLKPSRKVNPIIDY